MTHFTYQVASATVHARRRIRAATALIILLAGLLLSPAATLAAIRTTAADGLWSATATWTGGIKPVSGDVPVINHNVQIDESVGTDGAGMRNIVVNAASKTLSIKSGLSTPITIKFASSGSVPVSTASGSATNPFGTDLGESATAFGIFVARGHLNLESSDAALVTIQGGDGSYPVYVHHNWGDVYWNGSAWAAAYTGDNLIRLVGVTIKNLGMAVAGYEGVYHRSANTTASRVHIENCKVQNFYNLAKFGAPAKDCVIKGNTLSGAQHDTVACGSFAQTNLTIEANTETGPVGTGDNLFVYSAAIITGLSIKDNHLTGGAVSAKNLAYLFAGSTGVVVDDNRVVNNPRQTLTYGAVNDTFRAQFTSKAALTLKNNEFIQAHTIRIGCGVIEDNYLYDDGLYVPGVHGGIYYVATALDGIELRRNLTVLKQIIPSKTQFGFFLYSSAAGCSVQNAVIERNTFVNLDPASAKANDIAIRLGQADVDGDPCQSSIVRDNIAAGWTSGIKDDGGVLPIVVAAGATGKGNTYKRDTGVEQILNCGVHHNLFFDMAGTAWSTPNSAASAANGFTNGTDTHPNALYGDLTTDPKFRNAGGTARTDYMLLAGSPAIGTASDGGNMGAMGVYDAPETAGWVARVIPGRVGPARVAPSRVFQ